MEADHIARVMREFFRTAKQRRLAFLLALPHLTRARDIRQARETGDPRYRWSKN